MLAAPTSALDFPLTILIHEDAARKVWISYNASAYRGQRHNLPENLPPNIAVVRALTAKAAE
jgi:uncharacterized protein (DUF302 family)